MSSSVDELQRADLMDMAEVFVTASKIRRAELNIKPPRTLLLLLLLLEKPVGG